MVIGLAFGDDPPVELELPLLEPPQAATSAATATTHVPVKCLLTRMRLLLRVRANAPPRSLANVCGGEPYGSGVPPPNRRSDGRHPAWQMRSGDGASVRPRPRHRAAARSR